MAQRVFDCSIPQCGRPRAGCDMCNSHFCGAHMSPDFHKCSIGVRVPCGYPASAMVANRSFIYISRIWTMRPTTRSSLPKSTAFKVKSTTRQSANLLLVSITANLAPSNTLQRSWGQALSGAVPTITPASVSTMGHRLGSCACRVFRASLSDSQSLSLST